MKLASAQGIIQLRLVGHFTRGRTNRWQKYEKSNQRFQICRRFQLFKSICSSVHMNLLHKTLIKYSNIINLESVKIQIDG